jgi:hypothetical protein
MSLDLNPLFPKQTLAGYFTVRKMQALTSHKLQVTNMWDVHIYPENIS